MKTLIWDFNGTIIDDSDLCLSIENYMLEERGLKHGYTMEWYRDHFCFPVIDYYKLMGYDFDKYDYAELADEFNALYNNRFDEVTFIDGFEDLLKEAKEKGYQNVILSASEQQNLRRQCEKLGIQNEFEELLGIDDYFAGSKIEMALAWMAFQDLKPEECVYIGDTSHDYDVAKALGIENYYLVACGHQSYEVLSKISERTVHSLKEVKL